MKYNPLKKNRALKIASTAIIIFTIFSSNLTALAATPTNEPIPTPSEVLVVYNSSYVTDSDSDGTQDSLEVTNYYKNKRSIPAQNILGISAPTTEEITRTEYNTQIKASIESYLTSSGLRNSIKYIVLTKGIPLKIQNTNGTEYGVTNYSSVDAAVCLLYETYDTAWNIANPYFAVDTSYTKSYRFKTNHFSTSGVHLNYLVTRLDAYTMADVKAMIDRAFTADTSGTGYWVIDNYTNKGYTNMRTAWNYMQSLGQNLNPNSWSVSSMITTNPTGSVIGYTSNGIHAGMGDGYVSNNPVNANHLNFTLLPGAVFSTYESFNAYGFVNENQSTQGQVAEWIEIGGSGGIGNVYEPWASSIAHEEIFMPLYAIGYPWADAAYQSLAYMDFVSVVVGDPLMTIRENIPPAEVTNLNAVAGNAQASLSWTNPGDADFAGVKILRKTDSYSANSADGTVVYTGSGTSYINTGLANGTTYYYTAFAYDSVPNYSPGSASGTRISVIPTASSDTTPPAEVTNLRATALDTRISLSWTNPTDVDFVGVKILRKIGSYSSNSTDGTVVYSNNGTSYTDTGLANSTTYYYTAFAYDSVPNYSPGSASGARITATPVSQIPSPATFDNTPPSKPTGFNASAGNGQISLSWTNPGDADFAGVRVLRRTDYYPISPTNGTLVYKGTSTSYINTGLSNGTTYFYTIFAHDKTKNYSLIDYTVNAVATPYASGPITNRTAGSSPSVAFTEPNMTTQGNVSAMSASISSGQIVLTWTDPFNDINWKGTKLIRKIGSYPSSPTDGVTVYNGKYSTYRDTSVYAGTTYYYAAFAYNEWRNYSDGTVAGAKTSATAQ